jgi:hypothetical protein
MSGPFTPARLVDIYVADEPGTRGPQVFVRASDGKPITRVTSLRLSIDAEDMVFQGHMVRLGPNDGPGLHERVGEAIVVRRFEVLDREAAARAWEREDADLSYPELQPRGDPAMSMEKNAMIGPKTPDLEDVPNQKQAAARPRKSPEELDRQDPLKRGADEVRDRLKDEAK